jgi:Gluconate 2-dehydrogenase subunit 3
MQRRDALKLLLTGAVLPALPGEALALFRQAHPAAGYTVRTLNPHQNATVVVMTDLILPETDTPGAKAVRVNEFMDLILTEWATEDERARFLAGLADVDKQSQELFGKDFVDASAAQQTALLRSIDDAALAERGGMVRMANPVLVHDTQMQGKFWPVFKSMTLHGYYTSEIGFTKELKLEIIPGAFHGCTPADAQASKA